MIMQDMNHNNIVIVLCNGKLALLQNMMKYTDHDTWWSAC
jgi:hypothetical protein